MTLGILPVFMLGATATEMRAELGFGRGALGVAVGVFFGAVSLSSITGGRVAERIGPRNGLLVSSTAGAAVATLIAVATASFAHLVVLMAMAGIACGLAVPGASLALVRGVQARPGLMFGLKQSAPPAASMLAGVAVPVVAVEVGWRWAWALALVLAGLVFVLLPPATAFTPGRAAGSERDPRRKRSGFAVLGIGVAFGSAAALSVGAFFVTSAVDRGVGQGTAGVLLAVGGASGIAARLVVGALADRRDGGHLEVVAAMMLVGAGAYVLLAVAHSALAILVATVVAFGFGYGWSGLLFFAVAEARPEEPGLAIGVVNTGATAGGAIGPAAFGLVAATMSFAAAWTVAAVAAVAGGVLVVAGARRLVTAS